MNKDYTEWCGNNGSCDDIITIDQSLTAYDIFLINKPICKAQLASLKLTNNIPSLCSENSKYISLNEFITNDTGVYVYHCGYCKELHTVLLKNSNIYYDADITIINNGDDYFMVEVNIEE